ncbi:MAG: hypothetical protein JKY54_00930 [Flavobacteriales bacterium]|nr:hypothetical protein [Flavobacteriales bacterium]
MKKVYLIAALFTGILLTGCYKVHRTYIIKGKWYLNVFEIDGGSTNHMEGFLEEYTPGNGTYVIYMLDNGIMRGEYYIYDQLIYFRTGTWSLIDTKHIQMQMDHFVDGDFELELLDKENMVLNSDANDIEFFDIGEVKTVLRISREGKQD